MVSTLLICSAVRLLDFISLCSCLSVKEIMKLARRKSNMWLTYYPLASIIVSKWSAEVAKMGREVKIN